MPSQRALKGKQKPSRSPRMAVMAALVVVVGLVAYLIVAQSTGSQNALPASLVSTPVPGSLYGLLSGVSYSTLNTVGVPAGTTLPIQVSGSPLSQGGKPEVLYIGAEFCPYCAAERWSLIVALSKFGTFTNLSYMLSSPSDPVGTNIPTFSFYGSGYSSPYVSFVSVELTNRYGNVTLQTPTAEQSALWSTYDPPQNIPFVDIGNRYVVAGAQLSPGVIKQGGNWSQIASQLNDPGSSIAKSVDVAANTLIAAVCKVTGGQPAGVCSQPFATLSSLASSLSQYSTEYLYATSPEVRP
ncbi:MAG: DUF929 family protein [Nitrososphaerota archaeon]|nr:DUF929 family protein [Nitrososphaerota archaeon]